MKHTNNRPRLVAKRLAQLFIAVLLTATVSCSNNESKSWNPFVKKETACESAFRSIDKKINHFAGEITGRNAQAEKTALWQATAALLVVGIAFALIGGAAMGSKARRAFAASDSLTKPKPNTPPSEPTDESIL